MTKKKIIDKYYNPVYAFYLIVANKNVTIQDLLKKYIHRNGEKIDESSLDSLACTLYCKDKKTGAPCIIMKYNQDNSRKDIDKKADFINTISHEATHVAIATYNDIQQDLCYCSPEPFCYLQGWAAECIYKTLTK